MTKRTHDPKISAERISKRRKELGLTQKQLAKESFIVLSTLKQYEGAKRVPQDDCKEHLAKALAVDPDWLVGDSEYMNFEDRIQAFASGLYSIMNDSLNVLSTFIDFSDSIGYKFQVEEDRVILIAGGNKEKIIPIDAFNLFFAETIETVRHRFHDMERKDFVCAQPENKAYVEIESDNDNSNHVSSKDTKYDDLAQFVLDQTKGKEGDADDLT